MVLSGLTLAPAPHAPGASAAEVEQAVATPLVVGRNTVEIRNDTGFPILVKAILLVDGFPTITHVIEPHYLPSHLSTKTFSFGRHANDWIEIDVRRTEAEKPPPPYLGWLSKPPDGYHGKLFMVSEIFDEFQIFD
jgi:hypothetical protein